MASETPQQKSNTPNIWPWALVVGLLAGFVVGREISPRKGGGETAAEPAAAPTAAAPSPAAAPAMPGKIYKNEADFPASWTKSTALTNVAGLSWDGVTGEQKATAMQALNENNCECGCGMGSIAVCAHKDPNCPRSPKIAKRVVEMAKEGKGLKDILAYIGSENPKPGGGAAPSAAAPTPSSRKVAIPANAPRKGPKHAKVTIVEFSDFQCPFCSMVVPTMEQITKAYPKDVAFVFINFPLRSIHPQAADAAKAFVAAQRQGKGWEMHDKMFANQKALSAADLQKYAGEIGLNAGKFKKDFDDPATAKSVTDDEALASAAGVQGTPTFYANGREPQGRDFDSWKKLIDEEIKKADELLKKGTKPADLYDKLVEANMAAAPAPAAAAAAPAVPSNVKIDVGDSPAIGPRSAPVTVVAFSDFQCPYCSRAVPTMKEIEEKYKGKVRIAFKHLPLDFHQNAKIAAEASMAANEQGKFWPYHDKLFQNQQQLDRSSLEKYAAELGLNMTKFKAALDSGKYKKRVEDDAKLAASVGATGTPTFYVNGKQVVGALPFDQFKPVIDAALTAKN
jgi:protein-disulfide isomerase